jgi:LCP family protein required for cell wall assembly
LHELQEKRGIWKRLGLGALIVTLAAMGITIAAGFHEVHKIVSAFRAGGHLNLNGELAQADNGKPQTILLIGSDKRASSARDAKIFGSGARSDTMILMRLDPSKKATALLSLPRDLKVHIPGHGVAKLNAAYAYGGPKLTLETIKQVTGLRINHVINVDFRGFRDAVNAIGCVYTDVDRRYFNNNANPGDQYATINIQPGYQKLCGTNSLDYVRYRHTDNDIIRSARQQDFLRQAKSQVGIGKLISNQDKLVHVFGKYTSSDINSTAAVLRLLALAVDSAGHPIVEIHFQGKIGPSYVTATPYDIQQVTKQFLGVKSTRGPRGLAQPRNPKKHRKVVKKGGGGLIDYSSSGKGQALEAVRGGVRGMQVFYPSRLVPGSTIIAPPRVYEICGPHHRCWKSYRMVISRDLIGEYYGLQGTRWKDPPILHSPSDTKTIGGRTFEIYTDGDRVRLVAWRTKDAVYWVSNTLLQTLSRSQMIAIAKAAKPLG